MTENQFDKFICLIQKNNYQVELMEYDTNTFKKVLMFKSKNFFVPKILISFTDVSCSSGKDFLEELELINKKVKNLIGLLKQSLDRDKLIKMNEVINNYINYAKISGKTLFFEPNIALRIIEECRGLNIKILGIDAVKMTNESTQPFMDHSIDFSINPDDYDNIWDSAFDFIKSRENLGLLFEIVI